MKIKWKSYRPLLRGKNRLHLWSKFMLCWKMHSTPNFSYGSKCGLHSKNRSQSPGRVSQDVCLPWWWWPRAPSLTLHPCPGRWRWCRWDMPLDRTARSRGAPVVKDRMPSFPKLEYRRFHSNVGFFPFCDFTFLHLMFYCRQSRSIIKPLLNHVEEETL